VHALHVPGPDDREVPVIKRAEPGQPKTLGDGRYGGIDDAKQKVKMSFHEFGHAADVGALEYGELRMRLGTGRGPCSYVSTSIRR
jgi:hypothetical protein